ncbi:hypothetical protein FHW67_002714 [Herbaspirillum sp. Sphag1AN]|uniref:hypothetical protein n=1 Tax=unclassified Herbaspirillum TaxID=2624150 RepID=UPI001614FDBC|nr:MULTISPECIES: hypothetical protein [unclassified Herbaspirillum]MBB3213422.1 hypothetical protein [Herbaspirillum sp. Sphag1AN]MBB3246534.1 hypothetical protein [Herbaspirillum sp. Sphag64]
MSIEAYKIAVKIALTENVTRGLNMMAGHFKMVNRDAEALESRIASIGKMTLLGGGLIAAGTAGLKLLEGPLNKAMEYERYVANLRQMGLGDTQLSDAKKFVSATEIINTSMLDRMKVFTEAQGAFRESGKSGAEALEAAKAMTPILANFSVASSMLNGDKHAAAEMAMRNLNKTVETLGGLGDTKKATAIADGVFKAVQSSGRMVNEAQLKQFATMGGSATNQQSYQTIFAGLEPIIGMFGGSTTATGMLTAYNRVNGTMSMPPKLLLSEMMRLGMTDKTGKKQTAELARLQASDVVSYAQKMMQLYKTHGITKEIDVERENSIIFGRSGARIYNKLMSQMPVLQESMHAYDKSKGASEVVNDPANKALMARQNFQKKWEDLQLVLGQDGGLIDKATKGLTMLGSAISKVTTFAKEHPLLTKIAVGGLVLVSALAILAGGIALVVAVIGLIMTPIGAIVGGIALAVAALVAAGIAIYANWDTIKAKLAAAWESIKSGIGAVADWIINKWNWIKSFLPGGSDTPSPSQARDTIRTAPASGASQPADVYLDGQKVGNIMAKRMGAAMTRGLGTGFFDANLALPTPALNR